MDAPESSRVVRVRNIAVFPLSAVCKQFQSFLFNLKTGSEIEEFLSVARNSGLEDSVKKE